MRYQRRFARFTLEQIDALLRIWHAASAARASARREPVLAAMRAALDGRRGEVPDALPHGAGSFTNISGRVAASLRTIANHTYVRLAACLILAAGVCSLFVP